MYSYIYKEGQKNEPVFILLHGTGADENNLLPIANYLNANATIFSVRGNVSENGLNRYFKRHAEGKYDVEDLNKRGLELTEFIKEKASEYSFSLEDAIYIGFSNGSNIAINMLLLEDSTIDKAILFAPMYPLEVRDDIELSNKKIFISMGEHDPIVPISESMHVVNLFKNNQAEVTEYWVHTHEINENNLQASKKWLEKLN